MVDRIQDGEPNVETEAGALTRKAWVTPRLETSFVVEDTLSGSGNTNDGGGVGSSIS